jgi:hypothetical protein
VAHHIIQGWFEVSSLGETDLQMLCTPRVDGCTIFAFLAPTGPSTDFIAMMGTSHGGNNFFIFQSTPSEMK